MADMVTIGGIRYRPEDAVRLKEREGKPPAALSLKAAQPKNKAAKPKNK